MSKKIETPTLETERLILKPLTRDAADDIQKYFNNWNIIKNLLDIVPWPYPDEGAKDFINNKAFPRIKAGKAHIWTIRLKSNTAETIGLIEFRDAPETRDDHRGFWLAEPFWGNGYMTEATTIVNDFIFFTMKKDKIIVCNTVDNEGSKRVKEKTGAEFLKYKDVPHHRGKIKTAVWQVTAENWKKFREGQKEEQNE